MSREAKLVAAEVREQNKLYEKGETDRAFWLAQQQRLLRIKELEPKLTQTQIGELVGKSNQWVSRVFHWNSRAREIPNWNSGSNKRDEVASRAMRDPQKRKAALSNLTTEEKAAVIEDVADDATVEKVMAKPSQASRRIKRAAEDAEVRETRERIKKRQEDTAKRTPGVHSVSAFLWTIVRKVGGEWKRDLAVIRGEFGSLSEPEKQQIAESYHALRDELDLGLLELLGSEEVVDDVIEGSAREGGRRQLGS